MIRHLFVSTPKLSKRYLSPAPPISVSIRQANQETQFPEIAMMFIKTYIRNLILDQDTNKANSLSSAKLVQVFNRNQELVEIPYAVALYLCYYMKLII